MKNLKGFTLIEIVIVIALIGLTGTLLISLVNPAQQFKKSNDAQRKADLKQLQAVLELYRADNGEYPDSATFPSCGSPLTSGSTTYIRKIPCDPKNTDPYKYYYEFDDVTKTYTLTACLENVRDQQKDDTNIAPCSGGTTNWSYTLTSP